MKAKRTWLGLAFAVLAALAVGGLVAPPGGADEHKLKEVKDGEVTQQGEIDRPGEEEPVSPESVTPVGETVTIVSKTMTPPGKMAFKKFLSPNPWHFVDIETDPDAPPGSADTDTANAIKIRAEDVPETAGDWPLKGEGNLKRPPGGGGGSPKAFHWSAKMYKYRLVIKNPCDANSDGKINDDTNVDNNYTGNEFTYSTASPGVLLIPVRVEITPDTPEVRAEVQDKVRIRIDAINDSHGAGENVTLAWDNPWPGEATAGKGVYNAETQTWNATATFTKLPPLNDDFGKKTVTAEIVDSVSDEVQIEVFWPLLEEPCPWSDEDWVDSNYVKNHPNAEPATQDWPNWMYYWIQTVQLLGSEPPKLEYDEVGSRYHRPTKTIHIGYDCTWRWIKEYIDPASDNPLEGIDHFAWTAIHESQHHAFYLDWWLAKGIDCDKWWEEYQPTGGQEKEGTDYTLPDYDKDGDFIPNRVEYKQSVKEDPWVFTGHDPATDCTYDWQDYNSPTPGKLENVWPDEEELNCRMHTRQRGDHRKDWGNPGMNHETDDKFDD